MSDTTEGSADQSSESCLAGRPDFWSFPSADQLLMSSVADGTMPTSEEIIAAVNARLLRETEMLTAAELRTIHILDVQRTIILVDPEGGIRIPRFQFTEVNGRFDLIPVVRTVNERMLVTTDPWGATEWWLGLNTNVVLWDSAKGNYTGCPADYIGKPGEYNIKHLVDDLLENDSFS